MAITRVFTIESFITGIPAFASLRVNENNYDNGLFEYITDRMEDSLKNEQPTWFPMFAKIKNMNYWMLFLEQCVQVYRRKLDNGELEASEHMQKVMSDIAMAQKKYHWPEDRDAIRYVRDNDKFKLPGRKLSVSDIDGKKFYLYSLAYQAYGEDIFGSRKEVNLDGGMVFTYLNRLRFASKILTIRVVEEQCKQVLKELIKEQSNMMFEKFNNNMKPRSPIHDIKKYMLGLSDFCIGSSLRIGTTKYMVEKQTEGALADPGDIPHVISNPQTESPLDGKSFDDALISEQGGFVLEKYLRIVDKEDQTNVPEQIKNRANKLHGVVNLKDFQEFVGSLSPITKFSKYSDCFGDLKYVYEIPAQTLTLMGFSNSQIKEFLGLSGIPTGDISAMTAEVFQDELTPEQIEEFQLVPIDVTGSIGIRYGIRLCYIPPSGFPGANIPDDLAMEHKAFNVKGEGNKKYIFPIASTETDLLDAELSDFNWQNHDTDPYDLECMVDMLLMEPGAKLMFEKFIPMTAYTSFFAAFISMSFLAALGQGEGEREDDPENDGPPDEDGAGKWERLVFERTKSRCRKLFASFYNSNDFDPDDQDYDFSFKDWLKGMNPWANVMPGVLSWWHRRMLAERPFNKDGEDCGNAFANLFKK